MIPLHLSVRLSENFIARNSRGASQSWDKKEERNENAYPNVDPLGGLVPG